MAIQTLTQQAAIANEAQASGYTMSAQAQESLQNTLDSIQAGTITSGYGSKDAYVRANYGPTMSYDKFVRSWSATIWPLTTPEPGGLLHLRRQPAGCLL